MLHLESSALPGIVVALDVVKDSRARFCSGSILPPIHPLAVEHPKETLSGYDEITLPGANSAGLSQACMGLNPLQHEGMECVAASRQNRGWLKLVMIGVLAIYLTGGMVREAQAQASIFSQDFRLWSPVFVTVSLPSLFLAYMEVNPRFADLDNAGHIDQLLLRPALGYKLMENLSIWQGYAWVGNFNQAHTPSQSPFFDENRIYQEVNYTHKFDSFKILSRTRLEERWIEHADGTALRFRTMLRGMYPFPMAPEWALVAYDEIFVNLNTVGTTKGGKGPAAGFDQNRVFVGVNRTFSKSFNADFGYQNQLLNSRTIPNLANQMNHIILIQFFITL